MGRSRRALDLAALAAALAGVALVLAARLAARRSGEHAVETAEVAAARLGKVIGDQLKATRARAERIAELGPVRAAVASDDPVARDLGTSLGASDEVVEVFALRAGKPRSLVRRPEKARPVPLQQSPSLAITDDAGALAIVVSAQVGRPAVGSVAVLRRLPLADVRAALDLRGATCVLTGLDVPLTLSGARRRHIGRPTVPVVLPGLAHELALHVSTADTAATGGQLGGGAVVAFALLAFVISRARGDGPAGSPPALPLASLAQGRSRGLSMLAAPIGNIDSEGVTVAAPPPGDLGASGPLLLLAPELPPSSDRIPVVDVIADRYRVLGSLGRGATSSVYLAHATAPRADEPRVVAVKVYNESPPFTASELARRVAHASAVEHPHLVRLYDCGTTGDRLFLAMEYVEGCSVDTLLRELGAAREVMPLKQSIANESAAAQALEAAHRASFVHGAVRPSNVLIGRHGDIKVEGLGTARPYLSAYTAPEQALAAEVDVLGDVFALGMLLGELTRPPEGSSAPRPIALEMLVARATHRSPRRRQQSCGQLDEELAELATRFMDPPEGARLGDFVERVRRT
jgi:hypothetical protein